MPSLPDESTAPTGHTSPPRCRLYVMDISYFSGKVEAYLRYKRIPFDRIETHHRILLDPVHRWTGVAQVPAIELPGGGWLRESSAILQWFESRHPERAVLPEDPALAFLMHVIEDYADEWLWRPAMWWRWMPHGSARNLGWRIATEVGHSTPAPVPAWIQARAFAWRQRQTWLWGDGMTRANSDAIRDIYLDQLAALEAILADRPFLLGARPSLVDFGYFGSMFRHFFCDPDSGAVMRQRAAGVTEWVARLWNAQALPDAPAETKAEFLWPEGRGWTSILDDIAVRYLPYLEQNAAAHAAGRRCFDATLPGLDLPRSTTHPHRAACLAVLQAGFQRLTASQRDAVLGRFATPDVVAAILGQPPASAVPHVPPLPIREPLGQRKPTFQRWRERVFGMPR